MIFSGFLKVFPSRFVAAYVTAAGLLAGALVDAYAADPNTDIGKVQGYSGGFATAVAITPDGTTAYVTSQQPSAVHVIDTATNAEIGTVKNYTGFAFAITVSPDGKTVYVPNGGDITISVIDVATNTQTDTIPLPKTNGQNPPVNVYGSVSAMAISPDGTTAYLSFVPANPPDPGIAVIDLTTKEVSFILPPDSWNHGGGRILALSPDGEKAYVTNSANFINVWVVDIKNKKVVGTIKNWNFGCTANWMVYGGVSFSPDGKKAYIATRYCDAGASGVVAVDVATDTVIKFIQPPNQSDSFDVVFSSDGQYAYVMDGSGAVIDVETDTAAGALTLLDPAAGWWDPDTLWWDFNQVMAVTPDSKTLYITNPKGWVTVVNLPPPVPAFNNAGVLPSSGPVGTQVTIQGENLTWTTGVKLGGVAATDLKVKSDKELQVTAPPHALGPVGVTVVNDGGASIACAAYTYITTYHGGGVTDLAGHCGDPLRDIAVINPAILGNDLRLLTGLEAGDFNRDGHSDLAVASSKPDQAVNIYLAKPAGDFNWVTPSYQQSTNLYDIAGMVTGDFNNDGILDVVTGSSNSQGAIIYLQGKGNGDLNPPKLSATPADFNVDGNLDVVFVTERGFRVYLGDGKGQFTAYGLTPPAQDLQRFQQPTGPMMTTGDFNKDDKPDLLTAGQDGAAWLYLGTGQGLFERNPVRFTLEAGHSPRSVTAADFDGDGNLDFAVGSATKIFVYQGAGDGKTFTCHPGYEIPAAGGISLTVGDFNHDNLPDIAATLLDKGETRFFLNTGCNWAFVSSPSGLVTFQPTTFQPVVGDFNGDGNSDAAVLFNGGTGFTSSLIFPMPAGSQ
ncbi:YVTN family beta-propeller protein [Phyllobacterium leguminum]|uniref:YVTN family beta-propeller protein n=2 Tax=Phyllobacterium leguminum TaxID=314237 RepID=A0A318TCH7_9HYPH|nr:YVTN family beta-propeller protein [Phyllobacterium leguminum]